jgi:hypothetical protein
MSTALNSWNIEITWHQKFKNLSLEIMTRSDKRKEGGGGGRKWGGEEEGRGHTKKRE